MIINLTEVSLIQYKLNRQNSMTHKHKIRMIKLCKHYETILQIRIIKYKITKWIYIKQKQQSIKILLNIFKSISIQ